MEVNARQLLFVVIRNEPIEKSHPPTGPPTFVDIRLTRVESCSSDVEVSPGNLVVDKPLDELRGRDCATPAASARVLHVGEFGVDHLVVLGRKRHAPNQLSRLISGFRQALGKLIVVRKHAGILLPSATVNPTVRAPQSPNNFRLEPIPALTNKVRKK